MTRPRDSQRSKLYRAESTPPAMQGGEMPTVPEVQAFVDKVMGSAWAAKRWPRMSKRQVLVKDGRGRRRACGSFSYIKLPCWTRTKRVILHELAHSITLRLHRSTVAAHGREYAGVLVALVGRWMGEETARQLKAAFRKARVKYLPKQTGRKPSPAAIEALRRYREERAAAKAREVTP